MPKIKFKDVYPWVITVSALLGIWQFIVPRAKDLLDFRNNVTFDVNRIYDFDYVNGLFGNFRFKADLKITNPTDAVVLLKKPYIKAAINGNHVGDTEPSGETFTIKPNNSTLVTGIIVNIPLGNIGSLLPILNKLKKNQPTGNKLTLAVRTDVNGFPIEEEIEYQI